MCCNMLIIACTIAIFVSIILAIVMVAFSIIYRRRLERLTEYQINVSAQIDQSIPEILSLIIDECFKDYQVKELLPLREEYINSDREAEIRKELIDMVTTRISGAALDKLSLFYNSEGIANILADKIYITVMNYTINHNEGFKDE